MDAQRLRAISWLPSRAGGAGRVQRQIHDQPNGAAWLVAGDACRPFARDLPQFLLSVRSLAIHRIAAGGIPELSVSPEFKRPNENDCANRAARGSFPRNFGSIRQRSDRRTFGQAETASAQIFLRSRRLRLV